MQYLISRLQWAFSDIHKPSSSDLFMSSWEEDLLLSRYEWAMEKYGDRSWEEIDLEIIDAYWEILLNMTPKAASYYIAAYLATIVADTKSILDEYLFSDGIILHILLPDPLEMEYKWLNKILHGFTDDQRIVIWEFLQFINQVDPEFISPEKLAWGRVFYGVK